MKLLNLKYIHLITEQQNFRFKTTYEKWGLDNSYFLKAIDKTNGEIAGFIVYGKPSGFKNNNVIGILDFEVMPEYRKKALAFLLMKKVIQQIKQISGIKMIWLKAIPEEKNISLNNLVSFYKMFGFKSYKSNLSGKKDFPNVEMILKI